MRLLFVDKESETKKKKSRGKLIKKKVEEQHELEEQPTAWNNCVP